MSDQIPRIDQNPRDEKNRVEKSLEDVLSEACRALSLINDMATGFAAASSDAVDVRRESWWALSELAGEAKKGLDAAADALPSRIVVTRLDDWAGLVASVVAKPVTKPAA